MRCVRDHRQPGPGVPALKVTPGRMYHSATCVESLGLDIRRDVLLCFVIYSLFAYLSCLTPVAVLCLQKGECPRGEDCPMTHSVGIAALDVSQCPSVLRLTSTLFLSVTSGTLQPLHISLPLALVVQMFEYWMHPQRYRSKLCREGVKCSRIYCFFAHTSEV